VEGMAMLKTGTGTVYLLSSSTASQKSKTRPFASSIIKYGR